MSMSTRESMRRELKELAKLAETMGKQTAAEPADDAAYPVDFSNHGLERPVTPSSASRVSVAPVTTATMPPAYELEAKASPKRTGLVAVIVGASLAAALLGGAAVGMSRGNATAAVPSTEARAAAVAAPPPETTPVAAPQAAAPPVVVAPAAAPIAPVAAPVAKVAAPVAAPVVHRHMTPRVAAASPAAPAKVAASAPASVTDSDGIATPAAKPAAAPKAKPAAAAAAGGGTDSLEDLIRKEVAAHK
jgi:hypothetical protein